MQVFVNLLHSLNDILSLKYAKNEVTPFDEDVVTLR